MSFSILALVSTRDSHIKPDCEAGGMLPGPIWEMPCNDLFITYFEADEMRIYVKHNCNINLFHNKHYILKFNKFILQTMYVILIIILTKIQQSSRIFVPFFSIQYRLTDDWIDFKRRAHIPHFSVIFETNKFGQALIELRCRYILNRPQLIVPL
jgi:hypothetical protein